MNFGGSRLGFWFIKPLVVTTTPSPVIVTTTPSPVIVTTTPSPVIITTTPVPVVITTTAPPAAVPATLPGFGLRLSAASTLGIYWIFNINRQGTFSMEFSGGDYGFDTYINVDTQVTKPIGTVVSGDWISPKSSTVGDSYWVRFTGIYTSNLGWFSGYNYDASITSEASPQISTRATPKTDELFDSGWIRLNVDRAISLNSGGDSMGSYAFVGGAFAGPRSPIRLRIASDSSGANVLCDTLLGEFTVATTYVPQVGVQS